MKQIKYFVVCITMAILFPISAKADCNYERLAELSRIAGNVGLSYSYDFNEDSGLNYTVTISNITNDIYVVDQFTRKKVSNGEGTMIYHNGGKTINYGIYSNDNNCKGNIITIRNITLPFYNNYSQYEECSWYPDFKYCDLWIDTSNISQKKFDDEYESYLANLENSTRHATSDESSFISDNLVLIILVLCGFCLIPFLIYIKRRVSL